MTRTGIRAFAILLAGALCTATTLAAGTERQLISAADFGALPFMVGPKMSPDAKHVVTTAHLKGKKLLVILDLGPKTGPSHSFTMPGKWELGWYRWAGNERVLVSIGHADVLFGDDVYVTRLVMYDLKTDQAAFIGKKNEGVEGDNVIHIDRDGHWLLLNVQKTIYDYPSVYRVDLDTMDMKKVVSEHPHVWNWFADSSGTVRAGVGVEGRRWWLLYRKEADAKFEKVMRRTVKSTDDDEGVIERFIPLNGSDKGYAVTNARTGRYGLYRYDFASDSLGEKAREVQRTLAMAREDDRPVAGFVQELLERRRDVAIGEVERLLRLRLAGEECAEGRLAIARCPDRGAAVERARLAAQEQLGAGIGVRVVERGVPLLGVEERGRVDEEQRRAGIGRRRVPGRGPQRRVARLVRPRDPHLRLGIVAWGNRRQVRGVSGGHHELAHQLDAIEPIGEHGCNAEHDQDRNRIKKLSGQSASPLCNAA